MTMESRVLGCLVVAAASAAAFSGCLGHPASQLSTDDCEARTDHWNQRCPEVFLRDYHLHAQGMTLAVTDDAHLRISFTLLTIHQQGVTITSIRGFGGDYRAMNASLQFGDALPVKLAGKSSMPVRVTSNGTVNSIVDDLFYGITVSYNETAASALPHQLIFFNRCYSLENGVVSLKPTVKGSTGEQLDCTSKTYRTVGEVSSEAMIVHDFKRERHAFPAPEISAFWNEIQP